MFKVAFICPGYENLGLEYLSAVLKKEGFSVELFLDPILFAESGFIKNPVLKNIFCFKEQLLKELVTFAPSLVGIPVLSDNFPWAQDWVKEIKAVLDVPVIFGGIHPSSVPFKVLASSQVDYVCVGEGEKPLRDLCQALQNREDTTKIPQILTRSCSDPEREFLLQGVDINKIPFPDKELFYPKYPFFNSGYITTASRGCVFKCAYCCNNVWYKRYQGKFYRRRSVPNIIEELVQAKQKYAPAYIHFTDEIFNVEPEWLGAFVEEYKKAVALPFDCYIYPDLVTDEVARKLKEGGCFKVQMGVQTFDQNLRENFLSRKSDNAKIGEVINTFKKLNIFVACDNILGIPGEKEEGLTELIKFYHRYTPDSCELFWLKFYPGTDITEESFKEGIISSDEYLEIEERSLADGLMTQGRLGAENKFIKKYILWLKLLPGLKSKTREWIIKSRIFKLFPYLPLSLLIILNKFFKRARYDIYTERAYKRYKYFIYRKLLGKKQNL